MAIILGFTIALASAPPDRSDDFIAAAKIAVAANPPGTKGYSITGKSDYRVSVAESAFDAYARRSGVPAISFPPRCHCKRLYDSLRDVESRRSGSLADQSSNSLTSDDREKFKEACYIMANAPDATVSKRALEHLVIVCDRGDMKRLKAMLGKQDIDHGLIYLAFGKLGDESTLLLLSKALRGPFWEEAAAALEKIGGEMAIAAFAKGLSEVRDLERKEKLSLVLDGMRRPQQAAAR